MRLPLNLEPLSRCDTNSPAVRRHRARHTPRAFKRVDHVADTHLFDRLATAVGHPHERAGGAALEVVGPTLPPSFIPFIVKPGQFE